MKEFRFSPRWTLLFLGVILLCAVNSRNVWAAAPCCAIAAIDAQAGVVTAKETATGKTFQFKVSSSMSLAALKVGQPVEANFKTGKVTVRPSKAEPVSATILKPKPAEPAGHN